MLHADHHQCHFSFVRFRSPFLLLSLVLLIRGILKRIGYYKCMHTPLCTHLCIYHCCFHFICSFREQTGNNGFLHGERAPNPTPTQDQCSPRHPNLNKMRIPQFQPYYCMHARIHLFTHLTPNPLSSSLEASAELLPHCSFTACPLSLKG